MLAEYLAREPAPDERLEYMIAQGVANYVNANRGKGRPPYKLSEFMLFKGAWDQPEGDEEDSIESLVRTMGARRKM